MQARGAPEIGSVVDGYRYKGGNHRDRTSWEQVAPVDVSSEFGPGAMRYLGGNVGRVGPRGGYSDVNVPGANGGGGGEIREFEANAAARATLMDQGLRDYDGAVREGYNPTSWWNGAARNMEGVPVIGTGISNFMRSDVADRGRAAELQFTDGALRTTTGANAPEPEVVRADRSYFRAGGEGESVEVGKRQLRERFRDQSVRIAGDAYLAPPDPAGEMQPNGLPSYPGIRDAVAGVTGGMDTPTGGYGGSGGSGGPNTPQPGDVRVTQQPLAPTDTPNSLSAQGYRYDSARDIWTRDRQEQAPTPQEAVADRRDDNNWWRRIDGAVRGAADMASFGFADEIAAGGDALIGRGRGDSIGDRYSNNLQIQRGLDRADQQDTPVSRFAGQAAGALIAPGAATGGRFIANAPRLGHTLTRGAAVGGLMGAAYGAGSAEGNRLVGARDGAVGGALAGGAASTVVRAFPAAARGLFGGGRQRVDQVQALRDAGVFVTPGQAAGGFLKSLESVGARLPISGPAIRGARERGAESLNRAVANRALSNVDAGLPASVPVGAEAADFVSRRIGQEFDRAADMVPQVAPDEPFFSNLGQIAARRSDLAESSAAQFDNIIKDRLSRMTGPISGRQLRTIESELGGVASEVQDPQLRGMLMGVQSELQDLLARTNPEAGKVLQNARAGWADYVRMRDASAKAGGNMFSPSQLQTAVRTQDSSIGKGGVATGNARLQDLSRAANAVMPDSFGNPGTSDVGAWIGLAGLAAANPLAGATTAATLGAVATPYTMIGRRIVESLPRNAGPEQLRSAAQQLAKLAEQDPQVRPLLQQFMKSIGQASIPALSVAGGAAYAQ